jgi:hypothetical protein
MLVYSLAYFLKMEGKYSSEIWSFNGLHGVLSGEIELFTHHSDSMNCLRPLEHCGRGFESHSSMGVYVRLFSFCAVLCVGRGLAAG